MEVKKRQKHIRKTIKEMTVKREKFRKIILNEEMDEGF
jgi:hypothetical protein